MANSKYLMEAKNITLKIDGETILENVNFHLNPRESLTITGASGSGKTTLGRILAGIQKPTSGELFLTGIENRLMVDQQDHFIAYSGRRSMHHGQRYESSGMESIPTLLNFLERSLAQKPTRPKMQELTGILCELEISHLANSKILELSNGERKRTQLALALLKKPDLLVLDQPFVGLDFHSRKKLAELLDEKIDAKTCLIIITDPQTIPENSSYVLELDQGRIMQFTQRNKYTPKIDHSPQLWNEIDQGLFSLLPTKNEVSSDVVSMKNLQVELNGKTILKNINWQVKSGEQWALLGPNGAGKSTLLSLITADNPQGYNNHLILFDRQRGSGESIWDIKKRIGFVSPELHLYFLRGAGIFNTIPGLSNPNTTIHSSLSCTEVILSGMKDEVGFTSSPTSHQLKAAQTWLKILGLEKLRNRAFTQTSLGEQRVLLLARALVKSPQLLILDEPCQGLDQQQTDRFNHLLTIISQQLQTTLIYVTHRIDEIPSTVTQLLQLEKGKVKNQGSFNRDSFHWND